VALERNKRWAVAKAAPAIPPDTSDVGANEEFELLPMRPSKDETCEDTFDFIDVDEEEAPRNCAAASR
jgi:hypothetical protein